MSAVVLSPIATIMPTGYEELAIDDNFRLDHSANTDEEQEEEELLYGESSHITSEEEEHTSHYNEKDKMVQDNDNDDNMSVPSLSLENTANNEEQQESNISSTTSNNDYNNAWPALPTTTTTTKAATNIIEEEEKQNSMWPALPSSTTTTTTTQGNNNMDTTTSTTTIEEEKKEEDDDQYGASLFSSSFSSTTQIQTPQPSPQTQLSPPYGGLYNMGNTCYMNSALQMLASLDILLEKLQQHKPLNTSHQELHGEVISVLSQLKNGQTITPTKFKQILDEKSPLFIGYRQQDSHEFLATLIDLLDEDYLKKQHDDEEENKEDDNNNEEKMDVVATTPLPKEGEGEATEEEKVNQSSSSEEEQKEGTEEDLTKDMEVEASAPTQLSSSSNNNNNNRRKIVGLPDADEPPTAIRKIQSYSDLQPNDIEYLLHGDKNSKENEEATEGKNGNNSNSTNTEPQCKLYGGRAILNNNTSCPTVVPEDEEVVNNSNNHNDDVEMSDAATTTSTTANTEGTTTNSSSSCEKPYSPIDELFTTDIRVCLTCDSCKYSRSHNETYKHLSLEIGDDEDSSSSSPSSSSIEDGLRNFFKEEKRDIKCEKCFGESATQTMSIVKLPKYFLIHLKRFIVNYSSDYTSVTYRKNQTDVDFNTKLSITDDDNTNSSSGFFSVLSDYIADDITIPGRPNIVLPNTTTNTNNTNCWQYSSYNHIAKKEEDDDDDEEENEQQQEQYPYYSIRSIVNHIGSSASCGHYTADSYRLQFDENEKQLKQEEQEQEVNNNNNITTNNREWIRFNDSYVSKINDNDALNGSSKSTAYMIMYELQ